jgi:hypothetical protein
MRFLSLFASIAMLLGACAASPPPSPTSVAADRAEPPRMPEYVLAADFAGLVAAKVLEPLDLPALSHDEIEIFGEDIDGPAEAGILVLTSSLPGGSSQTAYLDHAGRVWVVVEQSRMHVPDGVSISATRTFRSRHRLPPGTRYAGMIHIVESTAEIPHAPAPLAPAA